MIQSVLFDKKLFTPKQAITWLKKHNYKYSKIDIKPNHLRFRQTTPKKGDAYRTKKLGDSGIELILEMNKLSGGANHTEQIKLFNEISKLFISDSVVVSLLFIVVKSLTKSVIFDLDIA